MRIISRDSCNPADEIFDIMLDLQPFLTQFPIECVQVFDDALGWAPKEFAETEDAEEDGGNQGNNQDANAAHTASASAGPDAAVAGGEQGTAADGSATNGYVYNESTGYYYDPVSGSSYDPNTGYTFIPATNQWCVYDQATGEYKPVTGADESAGAPGAMTSAGQGALEATAAALAATKQWSQPGTMSSAYGATAGPTQYAAAAAGSTITSKPAAVSGGRGAGAATTRAPAQISAAASRPAGGRGAGAGAGCATGGRGAGGRTQPGHERRKGAVIGAAPQYNPLGLLAAVNQLQVRGWHFDPHMHLR